MNIQASSKTVPTWALPIVVIVVVLTLCIWGWKVFASGDGPVGPAREVHAGMYDIRAEVQKMRASSNQSPHTGG